MEQHSYFIFVYGTLRDPSVNHKAHFLSVNSDYIGKATIQAKLYKVSWYPAVVLDEGENNIVHGDLYKIPVDKCEMVLHEIDGYEGIYETNKESEEYERVITKVKLNDGNVVDSWVYNYKAPVESAHQITSGDYLKFLSSDLN